MTLTCIPRSAVTVKPGLNKIKRLLRNRATAVKPKANCLKSSPLANDKTTTTVGHNKPNSVLGTKRKPEEALECLKVKRSKLDNCQSILAKLMRHKLSLPFRSPVDLDASGDYFKIINQPMDFGTVKRKLMQNSYTDSEEFEADVRLIFANAKLYHPSTNWVHIYATKLNRMFDVLWMPLKPKVMTEPIINPNLSPANNCVQKDECLEAVPDCSPSKALHAEKLKARFADTILRAQCKIDLLKGNKTDSATSQQEKESLKRNQDEGKARIEAEAKAVEAMKAECKLKKQREREREAARASLEKMERSIILDDSLSVMKELETLIGSSMLVVRCDHRLGRSWNRSDYGKTKSPLEQLGLYIKPEYRLGYDDDGDELSLLDVDLEEGEIRDWEHC